MREESGTPALGKNRLLPLRHLVQLTTFARQSSINEGFNDSKASRDSLNEALACDVHPTTGNILYCCKELSPGYSAIYRKMFDLAMGYGIHGRTVVAIPGEADDILLSLLENLLLALEVRDPFLLPSLRPLTPFFSSFSLLTDARGAI